MPDSVESQPTEIPAAEKALLAGAEHRMARAMWVLGVVGMVVCWLWRDWSWGAGFAIGAVLSALNFHWMKTAVGTLAEVASSQTVASSDGERQPRPRTKRAVVRFVLRYALIGVAGYVIFKSSFVSLRAFFLGLFLFLAAILAEIGYEIYCAFRNR